MNKILISLLLSLFLSVSQASVNDELLNYAKNGFEDDLMELLSRSDSDLNLNAQDQDGNSALHLSINNNNVNILKLLTGNIVNRFSINFNIKNKKGETPLYLAVLKCPGCVSELIKTKQVNINDGPVPPLAVAVLERANDELAANLILAGANVDINLTNADNEFDKVNLLFYISGKLRPKSLDAYLKLNRNLNIRGIQNKTPLMYAAHMGLLENVKKLVSAGALINLRDAKGNTALHYSAKSIGTKNLYNNELFLNGHTDKSIYDFLVESGAKIELTNLENKTAVQIYENDLSFNESFKKEFLGEGVLDAGYGLGIIVKIQTNSYYVSLKTVPCKAGMKNEYHSVVMLLNKPSGSTMIVYQIPFSSEEYRNNFLREIKEFQNSNFL